MSLRLIMWDVQHGSAVYIQTPNGKHAVIDLGSDGTFSPLEHLRRCGVRRLDHLTVTHPHMDHIDDILNFDLLDPRTLLIPKYLTEDDIRHGNPQLSHEAESKVQKYLEIRHRYVNPVDPQDDIRLPENNGGVSIKTFIPTQPFVGNLNNHSVVTVLEYSGVKVLIPGDNETASWEELLNRNEFVAAIARTHVLVAAHHGRESGYHSPLFNHFRPNITLISDGRTVDTSATSRYTNVSKGWSVRKRNETRQDRKCLTTRKDGTIEVTINSDYPIGSMDVLID